MIQRISAFIKKLRESKPTLRFLKIFGAVVGLSVLGLVGSGVCDRFLAIKPAKASGAIASALPVKGAASASVATVADSSREEPPAPLSSEAPVPSSSSVGGPCKVDGKVILNTATVEDLESLPGVGESKAQKIVELRTKLGKFTRLEELYRIKGIKHKLLEKLRPHLLLDPPPDC
jgi:competence ComEA-like helix-hairpin-helix protein